MRILIIADKLSGGAGNVAQQLASCFSREKENTVFLIVETNIQSKYDLTHVHIIKRKIDSTKLKNPIKTITRYYKKLSWLRTAINTCKADIIISFLNTISPDVLISQLFTKTPIIVSERSNPYQEWIKYNWKNRIKWTLSYFRANMIVYQFHCFESFFKYTYKKGKTCVIPNMIYYPKDGITKKAIINNDNLRFAAISTLYSVKRINMMIDIFAILWSKHPAIVLNIYGDGPDREKLEQQVCKLGLQNSILFHGHVTDTTKVLCNNDVLLMTSEREGFPNVILEAMNVGVPTVMFKCHDGLSEIITDGVNGFLIEPDNTNEFINKLQSLVVDPNIIQELSKNALSSKVQYSEEQVMHLWEKCIKFTIRNNSR